jgi:hypothetical protein
MSIFQSYCIEHPRTHAVIVIEGRSYVGAGLLASLYVLWRAGPLAFARALPINVLFILLGAMSLVSVLWLSGLAQIAALAVLFSLPLIQSRIMMRIVRRFFARAGWIVTRI